MMIIFFGEQTLGPKVSLTRKVYHLNTSCAFLEFLKNLVQLFSKGLLTEMFRGTRWDISNQSGSTPETSWINNFGHNVILIDPQTWLEERKICAKILSEATQIRDFEVLPLLQLFQISKCQYTICWNPTRYRWNLISLDLELYLETN